MCCSVSSSLSPSLSRSCEVGSERRKISISIIHWSLSEKKSGTQSLQNCKHLKDPESRCRYVQGALVDLWPWTSSRGDYWIKHGQQAKKMLPYIVSDIPSGSAGSVYGIYPDIISDILSGIYSDILSGILSDMCSDILSGMCSGPCMAHCIWSLR